MQAFGTSPVQYSLVSRRFHRMVLVRRAHWNDVQERMVDLLVGIIPQRDGSERHAMAKRWTMNQDRLRSPEELTARELLSMRLPICYDGEPTTIHRAAAKATPRRRQDSQAA